MMRFSTCVLIGFALFIRADQVDPADDDGSREAASARAFAATLDDAAKRLALRPFADADRLDWHYIPRSRPGLPLSAMTTGTRVAAHDLLASVLSPQGYLQASGVFFLEAELRRREKSEFRDPEAYHWTLFGEPTAGAAFGFRIEGHHLSLNVTRQGEQTRFTPYFIGSNPARIPDGSFAGFRLLGDKEDLGQDLFESLTGTLKEACWIAKDAPRDVILGPARVKADTEIAGVRAADLDAAAKDRLIAIVEGFAHDLRRDLARREIDRVRQAGIDNLAFAFAGSGRRGEPSYYRVQGPTLVIEVDRTAGGHGHVHALWRDPAGDFGADLLAAHLKSEHERAK